MLENGDDPSKVTDETFDRAIAVVQKAQDAGQIRRFYGNDYAQPLAKGDLAASMAWSGDIFLLADPKAEVGDARRREGSSGPTTCSSRSAAACRRRRPS